MAYYSKIDGQSIIEMYCMVFHQQVKREIEVSTTVGDPWS